MVSRHPLAALALPVYGLLGLGAWIWIAWAGLAPPGGLWLGQRPIEAAGVALALAALTVGLCRVLVRLSRGMDKLELHFAGLIGPARPGEILIMAATSAVGEELVFRGALQAVLGYPAASVIFGLAHPPPRRELWPWTISALVMGLVLGALMQHYQGLLAPVLLHFLINALNLRHMARRAREAGLTALTA